MIPHITREEYKDLVLQVKKPKYGNKHTIYRGESYDSKREAAVAHELYLDKRGGRYISVDRQVSIKLSVNGSLICIYRLDFVAVKPNGVTEYIEVKGMETKDWKLKAKLFEALYIHGHEDRVYRIIK